MRLTLSSYHALPTSDLECPRLGADEKQTFKATPVDENNRNKTAGETRDIEGWTK